MNIPERVEEIQKKFNRFIEKWCGVNFPHLIDSDENDGEEFREELRTALTETDQQARASELELLAVHLDRQLAGYTNVSVDSVYRYIEQRKETLSNPPSQV